MVPPSLALATKSTASPAKLVSAATAQRNPVRVLGSRGMFVGLSAGWACCVCELRDAERQAPTTSETPFFLSS